MNYSRNSLKELPECIFRLSDLKILLVAYNKLVNIDDDIGNLSRIEDLVTRLHPTIISGIPSLAVNLFTYVVYSLQ